MRQTRRMLNQQVRRVPAIPPAHSDLLSTLANRQEQSVTLTLDEAVGVEMTREWRERAKVDSVGDSFPDH